MSRKILATYLSLVLATGGLITLSAAPLSNPPPRSSATASETPADSCQPDATPSLDPRVASAQRQVREIFARLKDANFRLVKTTGDEAKRQFMKAISPAALERAIEAAKERGWSRTDSFTVFAVERKSGIVKTQDAIHDFNGEGRLLVWDWIYYDTTITAATLIVETYNPSTSTTFEMEYFVNDDWGFTRWARFLEGRDRDGRIYKEAKYNTRDANAPRLIRVGGGGGQCAEMTAWRSCMRECMKERLNQSVWAAVGAGAAAVRTCAGNATRAAPGGFWVSAGVFLGCELLAAGTAGGMAMIYNFGVRDSCDAAAHCGPKPEC